MEESKSQPPVKRLQCKDIPDGIFLDGIRFATLLSGSSSAMRHEVQYFLHVYALAVWGEQILDENGEFPWKLVVAKARQLIKKGKIDGCPCGCRGDYTIINKETNMQIAVKDVKPQQIIKDSSGQAVVVKSVTPSQSAGGGVIVTGTTVISVRDWSCRFINPDDQVEVVLSDSRDW